VQNASAKPIAKIFLRVDAKTRQPRVFFEKWVETTPNSVSSKTYTGDPVRTNLYWTVHLRNDTTKKTFVFSKKVGAYFQKFLKNVAARHS
jgi:N-glycosylase/DNA lyase